MAEKSQASENASCWISKLHAFEKLADICIVSGMLTAWDLPFYACSSYYTVIAGHGTLHKGERRSLTGAGSYGRKGRTNAHKRRRFLHLSESALYTLQTID